MEVTNLIKSLLKKLKARSYYLMLDTAQQIAH